MFESKVSRSDFLADRKKRHRRSLRAHSRVTEEWYVTPRGLVKVEELPEGWGLLEADPRTGRVSMTRRATIRRIGPDRFHEALMLAARACSQKYLAGRHCKWIHGLLELDPIEWQLVNPPERL